MTFPGWYSGGGAAAGASIDAASAAEQEAGTEAGKYVAPATAHRHPSAAKCWGKFTQSSTTVELGYNITSVADTGAGRMTVTIATDFSGVDWAASVTVEAVNTTTRVAAVSATNIPTATAIEMTCHDEGNNLVDPSAAWHLIGFGDQA